MVDPACCSLRFFLGIMAAFLILDFIRHIIFLAQVIINPYFSMYYGLGYGLFLILFLVAIVLIIIYLFAE